MQNHEDALTKDLCQYYQKALRIVTSKTQHLFQQLLLRDALIAKYSLGLTGPEHSHETTLQLEYDLLKKKCHEDSKLYAEVYESLRSKNTVLEIEYQQRITELSKLRAHACSITARLDCMTQEKKVNEETYRKIEKQEMEMYESNLVEYMEKLDVVSAVRDTLQEKIVTLQAINAQLTHQVSF